MNIIRQGDVCLVPTTTLPSGCTPVPLDGARIVLMYGEVTGHAHAIHDHGISEQVAAEIADAAIARARLWSAPDGARYLEVIETVHLSHEEHSTHAIPPGIYEIPVQMEYVAPAVQRQVAD